MNKFKINDIDIVNDTPFDMVSEGAYNIGVAVFDTADAAEAAELNLVANDELEAAEKKGGPALDVVNGYKWTLNSSPEARACAPYIDINFLEMKTGQLAQLLSQTINMFTDPYDGMYKLEVVRSLRLPYISNYHHQNMNNWEPLSLEAIGNIMGGGTVGGTTGAAVGASIAGAIQMARGLIAAAALPAYKTETPNVWRDRNEESVVVDFNLYNTDPDAYTQNKKLVDELIYWTLPKKLKATFALPPVLCEYHIPGIRRGLIAKVDLHVSTKGQSVMIGGENVPDAYNIQLTLADLLMQTKNIHPLSGPTGLNSSIRSSKAVNIYQGSLGVSISDVIDAGKAMKTKVDNMLGRDGQ